MPRTQTTALLLAGLLSLPLATTARAAPCERLSAAQRKLSQKIQRATHPYDCCDETLDRCLKQKRVCKLARRVRDQICRLAGQGKSPKHIRAALERRANSMDPMGR